MQNLVPTSIAGPAQRSPTLTSAGLSSPLPGGGNSSIPHNSFRQSGLTASSSFFPFPLGSTISGTTTNVKPPSIPASTSYQPSLTSSTTFKSGSFSSVPGSGGLSNGMIRSQVQPAATSAAAVGYKPAGIGAQIPSASPAADKKSAYGPGLLRLSSQMSGPGGISSHLGQRFGTAVSLSASTAGNQVPVPNPAQA